MAHDPELDHEWERDVEVARTAIREHLDRLDDAVKGLRYQTARLGDGPGNLFDVEWAEGPGARFAPDALDRIGQASYVLRCALYEGQGPTA